MLSEEQRQALAQPLDLNRIKQRSQGGRTFSYLEGHDMIETANTIFGFDGWSYRVADVHPVTTWTVERRGEPVKVTLYEAQVEVTVEGVTRSDIGHGITAADNADSHETAIKGAATDGLKRAMRTFGAQFGNSLYDSTGGNTQRRQSSGQQRASAASQATSDNRLVELAKRMKDEGLDNEAIAGVVGSRRREDILAWLDEKGRTIDLLLRLAAADDNDAEDAPPAGEENEG